jgi:hypothetical protein
MPWLEDERRNKDTVVDKPMEADMTSVTSVDSVFEEVQSPDYYTIKIRGVRVDCLEVIDALGLDFFLGNVLKYIWRAGKKPNNEVRSDLAKARVYLSRRIER